MMPGMPINDGEAIVALKRQRHDGKLLDSDFLGMADRFLSRLENVGPELEQLRRTLIELRVDVSRIDAHLDAMDERFNDLLRLLTTAVAARAVKRKKARKKVVKPSARQVARAKTLAGLRGAGRKKGRKR